MRRSEAALIAAGQPHGIAGQLNGYVPDASSYRTGYGSHNRIVIGLAGDSVYMREDRRGLPDSTPAQRLAVLREEWPGMRVTLRSRTESEDGRTIEYDYDGGRAPGIRRC